MFVQSFCETEICQRKPEVHSGRFLFPKPGEKPFLFHFMQILLSSNPHQVHTTDRELHSSYGDFEHRMKRVIFSDREIVPTSTQDSALMIQFRCCSAHLQ